jgi:hypothetical protein
MKIIREEGLPQHITRHAVRGIRNILKRLLVPGTCRFFFFCLIFSFFDFLRYVIILFLFVISWCGLIFFF